jgi:hypothetical protein
VCVNVNNRTSHLSQSIKVFVRAIRAEGRGLVQGVRVCVNVNNRTSHLSQSIKVFVRAIRAEGRGLVQGVWEQTIN